jgi:hypothetical protein
MWDTHTEGSPTAEGAAFPLLWINNLKNKKVLRLREATAALRVVEPVISGFLSLEASKMYKNVTYHLNNAQHCPNNV